ncbi:MAG TPA: hypothetical protein PK299_13550 [Anaerolineales bacterium]|nr:hypothetical protein [Anaerolineales bacterium]
MAKRASSRKKRLLGPIISMLSMSIVILICNNIPSIYLRLSGWEKIRSNTDEGRIFISGNEMLLEFYNVYDENNEYGKPLHYTFETIALNDNKYKTISKEYSHYSFCRSLEADEQYANEKIIQQQKFSLNCQQIYVQANTYNTQNNTDYRNVYITDNYVWLVKDEKLFVLKKGSNDTPSYVREYSNERVLGNFISTICGTDLILGDIGFYKFNINNLNFAYYSILPFNFYDGELTSIGFNQFNNSIIIANNQGVFIKKFDPMFFCE